MTWRGRRTIKRRQPHNAYLLVGSWWWSWWCGRWMNHHHIMLFSFQLPHSSFVQHLYIYKYSRVVMHSCLLAGRQAVTQADRYNCVIPYNSVYMNLVCDIVLMVGNKRDVYNIACCTCHIINLYFSSISPFISLHSHFILFFWEYIWFFPYFFK